jgi:UDP-hydrolysing UDP-N-acetyl-D-glucosamine 2-epimerase
MRIHYVSGSRADFGLMHHCLSTIHASRRHNLGLVLSGQHLSAAYGDTAAEIRASNLPVVHELPVELHGTDGAEMAGALAAELAGLTRFWQDERPDLVLLLGDRGEMVAAALAAVHLGIFVAHIHGGERSGTLDESFRHVISKLVHFHFPATEEAATRLMRMGEAQDAITVIGAPGLVGLTEDVSSDRSWLAARFGLSGRTALVVFHPVVQEAEASGAQVRILVETLLEDSWRALVFRPNSDAGGQAIDRYLDTLKGRGDLHVVSHIQRDAYLRALASSDLMIGNSSSGIIESASFGVPCVNLGSRQDDRLRNDNTIDCPDIAPDAIRAAIAAAGALAGPFVNRYGTGDTNRRLLAALDGLELRPDRLKKRITY